MIANWSSIMDFLDKYLELVIALLTVLVGGSAGLIIKLKIKKGDCNSKSIKVQNETQVNNSPDATTVSFNNSNNNIVNINPQDAASHPANTSVAYEENKKHFFKFTLEEIQKRINILIIDNDEESLQNLKKTLKKNWKVQSIKDLSNYESKKLKNSQIVCIDIHDVGQTLGYENGVQLLEGIAKKYPNKKLILYSAVSSFDNLFEKALTFADKSVSKNNQPEFLAAVECSAKDLFTEEKCISFLLDKYHSLHIIAEDITFGFFSEVIYRAINKEGVVESEQISNALHISGEKAELIAQTIQELLKK